MLGKHERDKEYGKVKMDKVGRSTDRLGEVGDDGRDGRVWVRLGEVW